MSRVQDYAPIIGVLEFMHCESSAKASSGIPTCRLTTPMFELQYRHATKAKKIISIMSQIATHARNQTLRREDTNEEFSIRLPWATNTEQHLQPSHTLPQPHPHPNYQTWSQSQCPIISWLLTDSGSGYDNLTNACSCSGSTGMPRSVEFLLIITGKGNQRRGPYAVSRGLDRCIDVQLTFQLVACSSWNLPRQQTCKDGYCIRFMKARLAGSAWSRRRPGYLENLSDIGPLICLQSCSQ